MATAIVHMTVTNPEAMAAYAKDAGAALAKWGAKPMAQGTPATVFGEGDMPGRAVVLSFPDHDAVKGWAEDPELADLHALRQSAGDCHIMVIA